MPATSATHAHARTSMETKSAGSLAASTFILGSGVAAAPARASRPKADGYTYAAC